LGKFGQGGTLYCERRWVGDIDVLEEEIGENVGNLISEITFRDVYVNVIQYA